MINKEMVFWEEKKKRTLVYLNEYIERKKLKVLNQTVSLSFLHTNKLLNKILTLIQKIKNINIIFKIT